MKKHFPVGSFSDIQHNSFSQHAQNHHYSGTSKKACLDYPKSRIKGGGYATTPSFRYFNLRGTSVVVGTPGRVLDQIRRGTLDLSETESLVFTMAGAIGSSTAACSAPPSANQFYRGQPRAAFRPLKRSCSKISFKTSRTICLRLRRKK